MTQDFDPHQRSDAAAAGYAAPNEDAPGTYAPPLAQSYYAVGQVTYGGYGGPPARSGFGVASFVISLVVILGGVALIVAFALIDDSTLGGVEESPYDGVLAFLVIGGLVLAGVGIGLGIAGAMQRDRRRLFAVLGLVFNGGVVLLVLGLIVFAIALDL